MRIMKFFLIAFLIGAVVPFSAAVSSDNAAKLSFFIGDVNTRAKTNAGWKKAVLNQELTLDSEVKTGAESRAELTFPSESVIRIGEHAHYKLETLDVSRDENDTEVSIFKGRLWAKVKKFAGKDNKFKARTTTAVAAVRGTVFRVDALPDSITEIYVYEGMVEVGGPRWAPEYGKPRKWGAPKEVKGPKQVSIDEWTEIVRAQQKLVVGPQGLVEKTQFDLEKDKQDEWVAFNLKRDKMVDSGDSEPIKMPKEE
ncbi:MAG: hypothetical protein GF307_06800 [candidate division Zixibacteria bacterium]|nr:hypothetical protein [candidate division Zixibacteria bacterium]